jgi:hypothetical protein
MLKGLLKLASGIVVLGASVFTAVAATGVAGDGMVEAFGASQVQRMSRGREVRTHLPDGPQQRQRDAELTCGDRFVTMGGCTRTT